MKNFAAQEITYSGDPQKAFAQTAAEPAGTFSIFADVKTNQLFDPFDDLIEDERHIATVKADSQVFIEFQSFAYEDEAIGIPLSTAMLRQSASTARTRRRLKSCSPWCSPIA